MYNCEVCSTPSVPNQPARRITIYKPGPIRQIERELKVCPLCCEGHANGIPLAALAKMHRPKPKVVPDLEPLRAGFIQAGKAVALFGQAIASSPKETPAPSPPANNKRRSSKTDELIANLEERGKGKRLKPLIKRGKHADRAKPKGKAETK